jgi:hypothetical protein
MMTLPSIIGAGLVLVLMSAPRLWAVGVHDGNGNGVSDVWEARYGLRNPSAGTDADGDGKSDLEEAQTGTDPGDPASRLELEMVRVTGAIPYVSWASKEGRSYQVEGLDAEGIWTPVGGAVLGSGALVGVADSTEPPSGMLAYRVVVTGGTALRPEIEEILSLMDTDGDGQNDWTEWRAGTSLIDPAEHFGIESVAFADTMSLSWPTVAGMRYRIETMVGAEWVPMEGNFLGTGGMQQIGAECPGGTAVFRVAVEMPDSDGDGLSDWEEELAGLDPNHPYGVEVERTDFEVLTEQLEEGGMMALDALNAVISVTAGGEGAVRVRRERGFAEVVVPLVIGGDAVAGVDYEALPTTVTLPFGVNEAVLPVRLLAGAPPTATKHVEIGLGGSPDFQMEEETTRSVTLLVENLINVRDYGATGNGLTDDGASIQVAIDALEASPQFNGLYFPSGIYRLANPIRDTTAPTGIFRILRMGQQDLSGRDLIFKGDPGSVLYSDVGSYRANMLLCRASFRSLSFDSMRFEQSPTPLWATPGYEPNGSDGVTVIREDGRRVSEITFKHCEFINCHRSVSIYGAGYEFRGRCDFLTFENCQLLNPYGANTANGLTAWGGGQQVYMTAWVANARYEDCLFEGGGEDMTDITTAPGGRLKDGCHFGSPLRLKFCNNVVRRMGIESVLQKNDNTLLGATTSSFVVPPADNLTEVTVTANNTSNTYVPGESIVIRTPLTPGVSASNTLLTIRDFNPISRELRLTNPGRPYSLPEGVGIASGRTIYLDERAEPTVATFEGNIVDGRIPSGGVAFPSLKGIVFISRSHVSGNLIVGCGQGIVSNEDVHTPDHPAGRGSVIEENMILTRNGQDYPAAFTTGISTWGMEERIRNNVISCPVSWKTVGIRAHGPGVLATNNHVSASEIVRNGYTSLVRAVGIGIDAGGSGFIGVANSTRGFDVGIGPAQGYQSRPYQALEHRSMLDVLSIDPIGLQNP